jgi:hypothetical protein
VKCPVPYETLVALVSGEGAAAAAGSGVLDETTASSVEDHLFACDRCGDEWTKLASLVGGLRGTIPMVISHVHRERMLAEGKRISVTEVREGVDTPAQFRPELDLMVFALKVDLTNIDRVRVDIVSPDGSKRFVEEDVPFDRARGEVLIACQRHFEGMFADDPTFEVHTMDPPRHVASYRVLHAWR